MTKLQYPFDYSDLEPAAAEVAQDDVRPSQARTTSDAQAEAFAFSQTISLKRIADALERLAPIASAHGLFKPDGTPNSILDIAGEHTGDTRRPKESP